MSYYTDLHGTFTSRMEWHFIFLSNRWFETSEKVSDIFKVIQKSYG